MILLEFHSFPFCVPEDNTYLLRLQNKNIFFPITAKKLNYFVGKPDCLECTCGPKKCLCQTAFNGKDGCKPKEQIETPTKAPISDEWAEALGDL